MEKPPGTGKIVLYNMASVSLNLYDTILVVWVMYFYLPPEGMGLVQYLPMGVIGLILAGGRVLDAITDPLIGYLSDHTRSRWGRRKPYIVLAGPILFLAFILVWVPPVEGNSLLNAVYLAVILFFYYWAYTAMLIPWFAFLPEMSQDNTVRVKIATIGVVIGVTGSLIGGGLSGPLMENFGAFHMAVLLGLVGLIAGELTVFGIKEKYVATDDSPSPGFFEFFRILKQVFGDKQVLSFSAMIMLAQMTFQLMSMNVPYFTTLILKRKESDASMLMGQVIIIIALAAPFWYMLLKKRAKRNVFRFILGWMALGFFSCYFIGSYPFFSIYTQAVLILSFTIIPFGGMFLIALGLIADITDYDELKYKDRREAIYYGIYGIVRKSGWALCSLVVVGIYSLFGYSAENHEGVKILWLVCSGCCVVSFLSFLPYKLGDSQEETRTIMQL